jgi:RNA-splicing ligase RtcB
MSANLRPVNIGAHAARNVEAHAARQRRQMGTLGSGNHYLEVQVVADILDPDAAKAFHLSKDEVVVTIHCGSRGRLSSASWSSGWVGYTQNCA